MSIHFRRFLGLNTIVTVMVFILGFVLFKTVFYRYFHYSSIILVLFAYGINIIVFYLATKNKVEANRSMVVVAKSFAIKFFSYLVLALIFLLLAETSEMKITFAILLFSLYIVYSILEIGSLIRFFKTD